mmetsp:Transcript_97908/g.261265  ORF Transcript_97908/g.261265 Transcript_97908/m.261265 type:complete len:427 (+) Transcript_97908:102-1382(+)
MHDLPLQEAKGPTTWVGMLGDPVTLSNVLTVAWPQVFYNIAMASVLPLAPFYGKELGLTDFETSILVAANQPGFTFGYATFAMLSDWGWSTRTINIVGAALCAFPPVLVVIWPVFWALVVFQVFQGIGISWLMCSTQGALVRVTNPAGLGRALGIMSILVVGAMVFGLLMPLFYAAGGIPLVFAVVGAVGFVMLIYMSCCAPARMFKHDGVAAARGVPWYERVTAVVSVPATLAILIIGSGLTMLVIGGYTIFPQVLASRYLMPPEVVAQIFATVQITRTIMAGPGGSLADALPGSGLLFALGMLKVLVLIATAYVVSVSVAAAVTTVALLGVYVAIGDSIPNGGLLGPALHKLFAAVNAAVGKGSIEEAYSMLGIFLSSGAFVGPLIGGYAYQVAGFDVATIVLALAALSALIPGHVMLWLHWAA